VYLHRRLAAAQDELNKTAGLCRRTEPSSRISLIPRNTSMAARRGGGPADAQGLERLTSGVGN
jgi:hypothetical protein